MWVCLRERIDPVSKQLNIFKRVKPPSWLPLCEEYLEQKSTEWPRAHLRSPLHPGFLSGCFPAARVQKNSMTNGSSSQAELS